MSCSTMSAGWTDQTRAVYWNLEVSAGEPFPPPSSKVHYIFVPTNEEVKKKIISICRILPLQVQNVLLQCWAPKKIGKTIVLTTISQPFGLSGVNKELELYRKGCLDHKLCVYPEERIAVGLPGRVFLNCTHEQTRDMHNYPTDQRPPCEDAIFSRIWGSFAVPVILNGECILVLEFVMDKPPDSFDNIIGEVCRLLQGAGFQSSIQTDGPRRTCINININSRKRMRRTQSLHHTYYCHLVPYIGRSSAYAAQKLRIKKCTLRNVCRNVGLPEWPGMPTKNTRASSAPDQTRVYQTVSETSSSGTSVDDSISSREARISAWSMEQTPTPITSASENLINQTVHAPIMNANDFDSWWDGGVYEGLLEIVMPANTFALKTQINQIASDTTFTKALIDPERDGITYQGKGTMAIEDLDHDMFVDSFDFDLKDPPVMLSEAYIKEIQQKLHSLISS